MCVSGRESGVPAISADDVDDWEPACACAAAAEVEDCAWPWSAALEDAGELWFDPCWCCECDDADGGLDP